MPDPTTHIIRPGPIRGKQVLCEPQKTSDADYVAELSERGMKTVNCRDCIYIMRQLAPFGLFFKE